MSKICQAVGIVLIGIIFIAAPGYSLDEQEVKIKNESGIIVVHNPKEPISPHGKAPLRLILTEDLVIGESDTDKAPLFFSIRTVRVDENDNIYVLDSRAGQIKVFDKQGNHLRDIGKKGQGPGEIMNPASMEVFKGKDIVIYDLGNGRISVFSSTGEVIKEIPAAKLFPAFRVVPDTHGDFIVYKLLRRAEGDEMELMKINDSLETIYDIARIKRKRLPSDVLLFYNATLSFSVLEDNTILWGNNLQYQFNFVNESGSIVKRIIKDYNSIEITDSLRKRDTEEMIKVRGEPYPPQLKLEFPESYPAFEYFGTSDTGQVFVRTYERNPDGARYYDIFDEEGKYIAKAPLDISPRVWKKNKIYAVEEDEKGYEFVRRYRVAWK